MKFLNFRYPLMILVGVLALLLVTPLSSSAGEDASTLSGRVVDMAGHPVSDLALGIQPIDMIEGEMWQMPTLIQHARSDAAGDFRIKGIAPGHAKLIVLPERGDFESDTEIYAISIGGLSFLPVDGPNLKIRGNVPLLKGANVDPKKVSAVGGIPLYIKSGVDIKDITVTVRPRMRIRCRVLLADETPLANAIVKFDLHYRSLDGANSGNYSVTPTYTDSNGYFAKYVNLPIFCTVSVDYQGDTAMGETFKIGEKQRRHDLVFQLSEASMPPVPNAPTPPLKR